MLCAVAALVPRTTPGTVRMLSVRVAAGDRGVTVTITYVLSDKQVWPSELGRALDLAGEIREGGFFP